MIRWSCGCVGFILGGESYVVDACDQSGLTLCKRDMSGKSSDALSQEDTAGLIDRLGGLIDDGYKFRDIRVLLKS